MTDEEIREEQDNEFEALKAIYFKDGLNDLRKRAPWNRWQPLDFVLTLAPQQGSMTEENARVDLHITCSERYPFDVPKIHIRNEKGISQEQTQQLLKELCKTAQELVGNVMIYELAQHVQEFLYKHSKPATKSFYEEMKLREQNEQLMEEEKINLQKEILAKEVKERQELHKQVNKRYRDERRLSEQTIDSDALRGSSCDSSIESSESFFQDHCEHEKKIINFFNLTVTRGQCLEHLPWNCILFTSMDNDNGQIYHLTEWTIESKDESCNDFHNHQILKQIVCIEQELRSLLRLRHSNLLHYINMQYSVLLQSKIIVNLLNEFVPGSNCHSLYLLRNIPVEVGMLRMIAQNVLIALDYLHRNHIVHKNVCAEFVYISNKGHIKLANFSVHQRLVDLVTQSTHSTNYSKKMDISKFGAMILSLSKGNCDIEEDLIKSYDLSEDLRDFIQKCNSKDENRYSTAQLLEHSFLKKPIYQNPQSSVLPILNDITPDNNTDDFNFLVQPNLQGKSRFETEFERLDYIGKGAYGQVFKMRNKLDRHVYAVKSIELNCKNKIVNRKIIREVKLLSGLNHENVVRYYNSWIESAVVPFYESNSQDELSNSPSRIRSKIIKPIENDIEKLVPRVAWSISYGGKSSKNRNDDSGSSSCDEDSWSLSSSDSDFCVEFEVDENQQTITQEEEEEEDILKQKSGIRQIQIMYIQMEFCDKSTLRTAIDNDLYKEKDRLWRLFREILEGLTHIHQQGMIHRDLKPVNIFLDSSDHVKIGDFGLARSNLLTKNEPIIELKSNVDTFGPSGEPHSLTGQIGTALYVAPELTSTAKATYNQKVDIYSLGIIFFEMSYKPCSTQSERIQILSKLRTEKIAFPKDIDEVTTPIQQKIIKWLLDHNHINRPTSQELLQSEHMPPPVLEERELRDLLRHTLKNSQLKAYKYLVQSCLNQPITTVQDITYDKDVGVPFSVRNLQFFNYVRNMVVKIFELHGAQELTVPTLMPRNKYYDGVESSVRLMTHSGSVVTLPYDLRIPLARYVAWNGITSLRRYSIAKVYREKRAFGFIPRELYECAFDIVTATPGNLMTDAEVVYVLHELAIAIPGLRDKNLLIRLNHMSLVKAILLHCGIKDRHSDIYSLLADARENKVTKIQVRTHLISNSVSNNNITTLFKFLGSEAPIDQIRNMLQTIMKRKHTEPANLTRQSLQELQTIIDHATNLGVTSTIVINLGLIYQTPQYSGMICQLAYSSFRKHKQTMEVIAAGGRYDEMIRSYQSMIHSSKDCLQSAVGVSFSLDRLVAIFSRFLQDDNSDNFVDIEVTHLDVIVGSIDNSSSALKYVAKILRDLRAASIKATFVHGSSQKEITEQRDELNVPFVIIYKDGQAKFQHCTNPEKWESYSLGVLVENVQRLVKTNRNPVDIDVPNINLARSESTHRTSYVQKEEASVNIIYLIHEGREKMAPSWKKRHEQLINTKMGDIFNRLNGDVTVFAMDVDAAVICSMSAFLNFESQDVFYKSFAKLREEYPKHKKYLDDICKKIYTQKGKLNHAVILFSLEDAIYRVLL